MAITAPAGLALMACWISPASAVEPRQLTWTAPGGPAPVTLRWPALTVPQPAARRPQAKDGQHRGNHAPLHRLRSTSTTGSTAGPRRGFGQSG